MITPKDARPARPEESGLSYLCVPSAFSASSAVKVLHRREQRDAKGRLTMFEIAQHTADIRIHINAPSVETLFGEAVRALMESMEPEGRGQAANVTIEVEAPDLTALLVDFLNDVLLRCHTQRVAFEPVSITIGDGVVIAEMQSIRVRGFEDDVKAVTYHEADVRQAEDGSWMTALVLDV